MLLMCSSHLAADASLQTHIEGQDLHLSTFNKSKAQDLILTAIPTTLGLMKNFRLPNSYHVKFLCAEDVQKMLSLKCRLKMANDFILRRPVGWSWSKIFSLRILIGWRCQRWRLILKCDPITIICFLELILDKSSHDVWPSCEKVVCMCNLQAWD